jgi:hypothetical protein
MAIVTVPCTMVGHRFQPEPRANIGNPLAMAANSSTSNARFVRRVAT